MDFDVVKILYTYGPFALLVFFVYVIEGRVRAALKDTSVPARISTTIYAATWVAIFVLCGSVVFIWIRLNVTDEATIYGTFENISAAQTISSRRSMYLRRDYERSNGIYDYQLRLVTPRRLPDGHRVDFDFSDSPNGISTRYGFAVRTSFYESPVAIRYVPSARGFVLEHAGTTEKLQPPAVDAAVSDVPVTWSAFSFLPTLFARQTPSRDTVYQRLDTLDPVIRRMARDELAARAKTELPQIERLLVSNGSVRVRVGVLSALNVSRAFNVDALSDDAYLAIVRAASDTDPALADEAFRFFGRFSVAGSVDLPDDRGGARARTASIKVKAVDPKRGDFTFIVAGSRQGSDAVVLELREIQVFEDSSGGTTRWLFSVLAAQQEVFRVPVRRYGDSPTPKVYPMKPADKARGSIRSVPGQPVNVRVIGYKPKSVPAVVVAPR